MSKRKPAKASKQARTPKIAAKAQRAAQAIVKSPKVHLRSVPAGSIESSPERSDLSKEEAPLVEIPAKSLQDDFKHTTIDNASKKGFDFSLASPVQAYQAKLLEMAQANMQFTLEFAQRFAAIRSPGEFLRVIEALTSKRIEMFQKYSSEMVVLSIKR